MITPDPPVGSASTQPMTFTEITDRLDRAARNGRRAHLDIELVRALVQHPAYAMLAEERIKELSASWENRPSQPAASSSAPTGSNTGPSETTGASVGTIPSDVHAAAEARASAEARLLTRPRRRGKH